MLIGGLNKTTLLDYPGRVAATVFTGGCNFRCPFCHNAGLVFRPLEQVIYTEEEILSFLKRRCGVLTGVCITGGEPTIQQDLPEFLQKIKELDLQIKLDTNGSHPRMLEELLQEGLLDYVAMDIKNAPKKYAETIGCLADGEQILSSVQASMRLLEASGIPYEFRTTVVQELHSREDLCEIGHWITGCPEYYLQKFVDSGELVDQTCGYHSYTDSEMKEFVEILENIEGMKGRVHLRGVS